MLITQQPLKLEKKINADSESLELKKNNVRLTKLKKKNFTK